MPELLDGGLVRVDMGKPRFEPADIPFIAEQDAVEHLLALDQINIAVGVVSMGNPHAVLCVNEVDSAPVAEWGPQIEHHPRFPQRVNAGFMQVVDRSHIRLRVFERGAGETLACGTGACAAVVSGIRRGLLDASVEVTTRGGVLRIEWAGNGHSVWMTGPAVTVFQGEVTL